jgi:hypothetical protein
MTSESTDWAYPDRTGESIETTGAEILSLDAVNDDTLTVEQDGIGALRDTEAEANDEDGLRDLSVVDRREARELGLALDRTGQPEPDLD